MNEKAIAWIIELLENREVKKAETVLRDAKRSIEAKRANTKSKRIYI